MRAIKLGWMDRRARWYFNSVLEGASSGRLTFVTWRMNLTFRGGLDFTAGKYLTASRNFCTALSIVCTTARCKKPASASGPSLKAFFPSSSLSAVATTHKTLTSSLRIVRVENLKGRHLEMVLKVCQRLSSVGDCCIILSLVLDSISLQSIEMEPTAAMAEHNGFSFLLLPFR